MNAQSNRTAIGDEHFRQVSTASVWVQKSGKQVAPLGFWEPGIWKAGEGCRGREAVQAGQGQARKSLAFDPVLSADFFLFLRTAAKYLS